MRIIVTGADGALGKAVVSAFRQNGERVACMTQSAVHDGDNNAKWFRCVDLADPDVARQTIRPAIAWLGGCDSLVHLVGSFDWRCLEESDIGDWRRLYSANVETAYSSIMAVLPSMKAGASIVAVGAAAAQSAQAGMGPYAAAKAGVARLVEALAEELRPRRIRANAVLPAIIDTPRNRLEMPGADPDEWTTPSAIAEVIRFLAYPTSSAINGALIPVTNHG